jgi:hypothetical protein
MADPGQCNSGSSTVPYSNIYVHNYIRGGHDEGTLFHLYVIRWIMSVADAIFSAVPVSVMRLFKHMSIPSRSNTWGKGGGGEYLMGLVPSFGTTLIWQPFLRQENFKSMSGSHSTS